MSVDDSESALIRRIYSAGEDSRAWDQVALDTLELCGACAGLTSIIDLSNPEINSYRVYRHDEPSVAISLADYNQTFGRESEASSAVQRRVDEAASAGADQLFDEFVKWNNLKFGSTQHYLARSTPRDDLTLSFSIHFAPGQGNPQSTRRFQMLFDHMECAVRLRRKTFSRKSDRCLVLLDSSTTVRRLTARAAQILQPDAALHVVGDRLKTADSKDQSRLDRAVLKAINKAGTDTAPQAIELNASNGRRWIVVIRPTISTYGLFGQPRCELFVEIHNGLPPLGSIDLLQSLFDLTGREMQVTRLITNGYSIESLAAQMGISPNTAKAHMRAIFFKTKTSRQTELLHLCAGLSSHI